MLLGAYSFETPQDLHEEFWEIHPTGDEVIFLMSGVVDLELLEANGPRRTRLSAGCGVIVPAGVWHRFRQEQPGKMVAMTPCEGTRLSLIPE
ncbi:cupin domain-containing protein [Hylemonella sp. W303a]|uniref:cupin domain-containing protein n=1 Tax=Hylemonella sp. W303a TaxID=3389873 RepID=UPI00396B37DA